MTHECTLKEAFIIKSLDEIQPDWRTGADVRRETKDKIRERVAKKYADIFDPDNSACITIRSIEKTLGRIRDKLEISSKMFESKEKHNIIKEFHQPIRAGSNNSDSSALKPAPSSDVQATAEPAEPAKEPEEEPEQPEQETAKGEITSEPAASSQDEIDLKPGLESDEIASQPQEEAQEQAETHDEGGEDTKASRETYEKMFGGDKPADGKESQLVKKTPTPDMKVEPVKPEPEKPPLKIPDDYTPETIFQCLSCYERFEIQQNTACPFCHSENIIESAFDKLPCDYTPRKKANEQDTDEDDEDLKYWQELINKNNIDTPADYKTAKELIKYFQKLELETSGGYPLEYEKRFAYNGGKYRVVAFGVNNEERGRDGILGIIFIKE